LAIFASAFSATSAVKFFIFSRPRPQKRKIRLISCLTYGNFYTLKEKKSGEQERIPGRP
jgi:hypothetical protein